MIVVCPVEVEYLVLTEQLVETDGVVVILDVVVEAVQTDVVEGVVALFSVEEDDEDELELP